MATFFGRRLVCDVVDFLEEAVFFADLGGADSLGSDFLLVVFFAVDFCAVDFVVVDFVAVVFAVDFFPARLDGVRPLAVLLCFSVVDFSFVVRALLARGFAVPDDSARVDFVFRFVV